MSGTRKQPGPAEPAKRGAAAWRAQRDEIARRNDEASRRSRQRRQARYDEETVRRTVAERLERAHLAKRNS
jgi:hypothetical protein